MKQIGSVVKKVEEKSNGFIPFYNSKLHFGNSQFTSRLGEWRGVAFMLTLLELDMPVFR